MNKQICAGCGSTQDIEDLFCMGCGVSMKTDEDRCRNFNYDFAVLQKMQFIPLNIKVDHQLYHRDKFNV